MCLVCTLQLRTGFKYTESIFDKVSLYIVLVLLTQLRASYVHVGHRLSVTGGANAVVQSTTNACRLQQVAAGCSPIVSRVMLEGQL